MNNDLLERLAQAETEAERSWIVTESLLQKLSPSLSAAVWAVAVPHWFDAEILAALLPNLQDQAEGLYVELQALSFVEVFPDRGHNVHEQTRKLMLDRLWQENPEQFRLFSARAAAYFAQDAAQANAQDPEPALQIEWLYHLAAVDANWEGSELWDLAQTWTNAFRRAELESLIKALLEQVESNRTASPVKAGVYYWAGRAKSQFYGTTEALDRYEQALSFYRDIGDRLGEADTLQAIGSVLQFLDRTTEALDRYEQALRFYRDIGDRLGEANTLQAIGDVLQFLKRSTEALDRYEQALRFYRDIGDRLGEANTLQAIGDVLQFFDRITEALDTYEQALSFFREIGDRRGEANTLQAMGTMQKDGVQGLATCLEALELYVQIGDQYSQSRNLIYFTAEAQLKLGQRDEAVHSLTRAAELAIEIDYKPLYKAAAAKTQSIREALKPVPALRQFNIEIRQFNTEIEWLLKSKKPRARSLFSFIRRTLVQFRLEGVCSDSEVFNEAYRRGTNYIGKGNKINHVHAWIRKTSYSVVLELSRKRERFQFVENVENEVMERGLIASLLAPEDMIEQDLEGVSVALQQILQELDMGDRLIIYLRTFENFSWNQVAQRLIELGEERQSEAALRKRSQRIMQRMRIAYHNIRPPEPFEFD